MGFSLKDCVARLRGNVMTETAKEVKSYLERLANEGFVFAKFDKDGRLVEAKGLESVKETEVNSPEAEAEKEQPAEPAEEAPKEAEKPAEPAEEAPKEAEKPAEEAPKEAEQPAEKDPKEAEQPSEEEEGVEL